MKSKLVLLVTFIFVASLCIGCKDITGTLKARFSRATQDVSATSYGNFGNTAEETAMIDAVTDKYGDLRESGSPRILELMLTSNVVNYIPADRVSQYSKDTDKFYAWFIYDNFSEDTISVEWIYLDDNFSIGTSQSKTGKDFGRGSFTLEAPDEGWPLGSYRVKVSGKGVTETVDFGVIDGNTVSVAILLPDGTVDLEGLAAAPSYTGTAATTTTGTGSGTATDSSWGAGSMTTPTVPSSTPAATPATTPTPTYTGTPATTATTASEYTIFNNINTGAVSSGPSAATTFTISEPHVITFILNYHWNGGKGTTPGKISLKHSDGTVYGPWQSSPSYSHGVDDTEPPYHYWRVKPNVLIKAGTYSVVDSEPSTWSRNSGSKNAGFSQVKGYKSSSAAGSGTATTTSGTSAGTTGTTSAAAGRQVWHLKGVEYKPTPMDGKIRPDFNIKASGGKGNFQIHVWQLNSSLKPTGRENTMTLIWTDPPEYIKPGDRPTMYFEQKSVNNNDYIFQFSVPQFSNGLYFATPDGEVYNLHPFKGTLTLNAGMSKGYKGQTLTLKKSFGIGYYYDFIYTYEWLD